MPLFEKVLPKEVEGRMRWRKVAHCWMEARWRRLGPAPFSRKERRLTRHGKTQLAFPVLWRNDTTVKSSNQEHKNCDSLWTRTWKLKNTEPSGVPPHRTDRCRSCGRSIKKMTRCQGHMGSQNGWKSTSNTRWEDWEKRTWENTTW